MPRDQDGISRAGDRTGRWRGRLRADWRSGGTKFGGAQCTPPNPHRLLCRTRPVRPKRQDAVLFCLLRARHARREMGSDHPARPSTPLIVARFACSVVFLHRIRSFTVERISKTIRKESLPLCLPVQKEKEKEFATHHAWSPRRTYVFRAPRPAWKLCFFFLQYESSVEGLWSRSSDHHTRVSISSWRARAVRTAGPAVPQPLPPYQPTHPRGNGPSVLARLYVTVWSTATPYHPK
jgi:hypothetical protein